MKNTADSIIPTTSRNYSLLNILTLFIYIMIQYSYYEKIYC